MKVTPARIVEHAKSDEGKKQLRYAGVSLVFVPLGQILIQIFGAMMDRNYTAASIVTAAVLTLPNFFANKYFVWKETSKDNLRTQVLVFWVAAMLGVTFATGLTYLVEQVAKDQSALVEAGAVFAAQLVGFGIVWIGRFLVLDKWLFKVTHHGEEPPEEMMEELHREFPV